jgi:hypothetical protein
LTEERGAVIGHLLFAGMLTGVIVWVIFHIQKKAHRCHWCVRATAKVDDLPNPERFQVRHILWQEGMASPFDISSYEICPNCKRIFDERWFIYNWEMSTRWCACGCRLKRPWDLDPADIREAVDDLRPDVIPRLRQLYTDSELSKLYGGFVDMEYRQEKLTEDHALFFCRYCRRVYMWIPLGGYQVFQCVSTRHDKYDGNSRSPFKVLRR